MLGWLRILVFSGLFAAALVPLGSVSAQGADRDLLSNQACRANPDSEDCICRDVYEFSRTPKFIDISSAPYLRAAPVVQTIHPDGRVTYAAPVPPRGPEGFPYYSPEEGRWVGGLPEDYEDLENSKYAAYCSLEYFQENQYRLWYFALAFGGTLAAISIAWGGFVYMQESVSGETRSTARTTVLRVVIGLVLLACAFIVWDAVSGIFLDGSAVWDLRPGILERY